MFIIFSQYIKALSAVCLCMQIQCFCNRCSLFIIILILSEMIYVSERVMVIRDLL